MLRRLRVLAIPLPVVVALAVPADASADVAIFGAVPSPAYSADVVAKIQAVGNPSLGQVDLYDAAAMTPTLMELEAYDAVLVFSDTGFADPFALGQVLADYSDGGGGVVVATFAYSVALAGRFVDDGYLPMGLGPQSQNVLHTIVIDDPAHRIMDTVEAFNGGSSSYHHAPTTLAAGAALVASWDHGEPLASVATPVAGRVVSLNMYPPSSDARDDFWDATTDGGEIMANALWWAIGSVCGDNYVEEGEACDDGNLEDTDACLSSCVAASCGDGQVWEGMEACDDGNADDTDACLVGCVAASCGDGVVWSGTEECDDGNDEDGDDCANDCTLNLGGSTSTSGGTGDASSGGGGSDESGGATGGDDTTGGGGLTSGGDASAGATMTAGSTSAAGETGGSTGGGIEPSPPASTADPGGCGCATDEKTRGPAGWLALVFLAGLCRRRRRLAA